MADITVVNLEGWAFGGSRKGFIDAGILAVVFNGRLGCMVSNGVGSHGRAFVSSPRREGSILGLLYKRSIEPDRMGRSRSNWRGAYFRGCSFHVLVYIYLDVVPIVHSLIESD